MYSIIQNIRDFYDITVFLCVLFVGVFSILVDYTFFKKVKYKKDGAITLGIGVVYVVLSFALLIISKF